MNYENSNSMDEDNMKILYDIDLTQCRLCQENDGNIEFLTSKTLCERIKLCIRINLEDHDENLPKSICENCNEFVSSFYIFQENCKQIDEQLKNLLNTRKQQENLRKSTIHLKPSVETTIFTETEPQKFILVKFEESQEDSQVSVKDENSEISVSETQVLEEINSNPMNVFYHTEENIFYENELNYEEEHLDYSDLENSKSDLENDKSDIENDKSDLENDKSELDESKSDLEENKKDTRHYICPECSKFYTEKRSLKRHVLGAHPEKPDIWRHVKAFKSCMCIACGKPFRDKFELKTHVLTDHPDQPNIWQRSDLQDGDEFKKKNAQSFTCSACGNSYTEIRSLKRHVVSKHPDQPDIWKEAKVSFVMKRVWRRDDSDQSFMCSECGNTYSYFRSLRRHALQHHGTKITASESESVKIKMEELPIQDETHSSRPMYECNLCGKILTEKRSLKRHIWKVHPDNSPFPKREIQCGPKYACTVENCDATFTTKEHFQRHQYKEHGVKEYLCQKCGKCFRDIKNLESHETYHLDIMPHKCPKCDLRFRHSANLKVHIRNHHEGHRYYCTKCGRAFLTNCTRKRHELIHTGIKDFKCDQCPAEFYTIKELKCHKRYHNNIRPHFCDICYKTFVTKTVLRVHMRSHTGERPFKCDVNGCSKCFAEKAKMYRHKRNIHHVNPITGEMI